MSLEELILKVELNENKDDCTNARQDRIFRFLLEGGYSSKEATEDVIGYFEEDLENSRGVHKQLKQSKPTTDKAKLKHVYNLRYWAYRVRDSKYYLDYIKSGLK